MTTNYHYEAESVRSQARGAWSEILRQLAPALDEAIDKAPRHVDCPFPGHGGKKDFRLFRDVSETGGGVCTCGTSHDGFELLMKINGWQFKDALKEVGDLIGAERIEHTKPKSKANASTQYTVPEPQGEPKRVIKGTILRFGTAPFRFEDVNSPSFFVEIELKNGAKQVHWGVDLERALQASVVKEGHKVILKHFGKTPVKITIQPKKKDESPSEKSVHKNIWHCENLTIPASEEGIDQENTQEDAKADAPQEPSTKAKANPEWLEKAKADAAKREKRRQLGDERIQKQHEDVWNQCLGTDSDIASPVHRYLHSRGINITATRRNYLSSEHVRFSTGSDYYEENDEKEYVKIGVFPAMVCAVRSPEGEILTLHRTYLTNDGQKAPVESARKMMPVPQNVKLGGSAIRLGEPLNGYLGVAEGLETALAATQGTGVPCWSTVNAALLSQFSPPADVHTVVVFADKDHSLTGEIAAGQLKAKLESEGLKVLVMLPQHAIPKNAKGIDWNDVLKQHGLLGFPSRRAMDQMIKKTA